jgi:Holliday junction resolvase RusA-like endonuclease
MNVCIIEIDGEPVPKQSYRATKRGGGYTPERVKTWQTLVKLKAREAWRRDPLTGPVAMRVVFRLGNRRRVDLENLQKAIGDALNGVVYQDDSQITSLHLAKMLHEKPGVLIEVAGGEVLPW